VIGELAVAGPFERRPGHSGDAEPILHWLVQTAGDYPNLVAGRPPPGLLSPAEQARYQELKVDKRRRDWLLGRWTAKQLLQGVLIELSGWVAPLDRLVIANEPGGRPYLELTGMPPLWQRSLLSLSISHSGERCLCAAVAGTGWLVGADVEQIAPRSAGFVADYFGVAEQALVSAAPAGQRDELVNAIWSGKEAALKVLGVGLGRDSRDVICLPDGLAAGWAGWRPLRLQLERLHNDAEAWPMAGWWRSDGEYVYTLALGHPAAGRAAS
jgi:4'-phosphopantetheinyl transferase